MVGRYRSKEGIDIFPETDFYHPYTPDEIDYDGMLKDKEHIHVLAHRSGIGKTYNVLPDFSPVNLFTVRRAHKLKQE